jgi:hypothetical protein
MGVQPVCQLASGGGDRGDSRHAGTYGMWGTIRDGHNSTGAVEQRPAVTSCGPMAGPAHGGQAGEWRSASSGKQTGKPEAPRSAAHQGFIDGR